MLRPDCICVWIFSTTSPSWMRSWVSLMPVISENALASVLRLVFMGRDRLGDDVDLHAGEGLRRVHEPFHLLQLLVLGERRGLEFAVDPAAGLLHAGEGGAVLPSAMATTLVETKSFRRR